MVCCDRLSRASRALPEVQRALRDAQAAAHQSRGRGRFAGIGPTDDPAGGFSASYGIHTDERFETYVAYEVDAKGHLHVTVLGSELLLTPATERAIAKACQRPLP